MRDPCAHHGVTKMKSSPQQRQLRQDILLLSFSSLQMQLGDVVGSDKGKMRSLETGMNIKRGRMGRRKRTVNCWPGCQNTMTVLAAGREVCAGRLPFWWDDVQGS